MKFIDVLHELLRRGQKIVPHHLDRDLHLRSAASGITLRISSWLREPALIEILCLGVGHFARHRQHRVGAVPTGVLDRPLQNLDSLGPHFRIGIRKANLPVVRIDHAVNLDSRLLARLGRLGKSTSLGLSISTPWKPSSLTRLSLSSIEAFGNLIIAYLTAFFRLRFGSAAMSFLPGRSQANHCKPHARELQKSPTIEIKAIHSCSRENSSLSTAAPLMNQSCY